MAGMGARTPLSLNLTILPIHSNSLPRTSRVYLEDMTMLPRTNIFPALIAVALAGLFLLQLPPVGAEESDSEPYAGLYIDSFGVSGVIDHHYAITELTQHFRNTGEDAEEARFQVKLPARAFISNFSLEVDGVTYYAVVMGKDTAQEEYANASAAGRPGIRDQYSTRHDIGRHPFSGGFPLAHDITRSRATHRPEKSGVESRRIPKRPGQRAKTRRPHARYEIPRLHSHPEH